jgi:hypothetical protein
MTCLWRDDNEPNFIVQNPQGRSGDGDDDERPKCRNGCRWGEDIGGGGVDGSGDISRDDALRLSPFNKGPVVVNL